MMHLVWLFDKDIHQAALIWALLFSLSIGILVWVTIRNKKD